MDTVETGVILALLVATEKITPEEADKLKEHLAGERVPKKWREVLERWEFIIGRKLTGILSL